MTVRLRPLIKPDGRISRIRLSESLHHKAFSGSMNGLGFAIERTLELSKLLWGCCLLRAISRSFAPVLRVRTSCVPSHRFEVDSRLWVQYPQIQPFPFGVTMNASDFLADSLRLTGDAGLRVGLNLGSVLVHRPGSPRLFDAYRPDVLTTLTPAEFTGGGDCLSCEQRPSHKTPEARRLCSFNITRLIRCGSSSFRPVGSLPGLLNPLQPRGWTGTWPFRREPPNSTGGTCTHELRTLRGLLRGGLFIATNGPQLILFVFRRRGFRHPGASQAACAKPRPRLGTGPCAAPPKNKKKGWGLRFSLQTGHPYGVWGVTDQPRKLSGPAVSLVSPRKSCG